jgi:hypothetical protein
MKTSRLSFVLAFLLALTTALFSACDTSQSSAELAPWLGTWTFTDRCSADTSEYSLIITQGSVLRKTIFLEGIGLYQTGFRLEGLVTGNRLVIPIQAFRISSAPEVFYEFSGSGVLGSAGITIDYTVVTLQDGIVFDVDNCTATGI